MLEVPKHILQKLLCAQCGAYLSNGPIMLSKQNDQICGRCFKILPDDLKANYLHQIGLEAVAELLIFPCRYSPQGCTHTFQWNKDEDHEVKCPHRYNTLPLEEFLSMSGNKETGTEHTSESEELQLQVSCENVFDSNYFEGVDSLKVKAEISGKCGGELTVTNTLNSQVKTDAVLNCEMVIALGTVPKIAFSFIDVRNKEVEHLYETVTHLSQNIKCANCKRNIFNLEIFHCPFSHSLCKQCKSSVCEICGRLPNSVAQHYCKNFTKGCTQLFSGVEIKKHEIDCEFSNFKCPFYDECAFNDCINNLNAHFMHTHHKHVTTANEVDVVLTRKDQSWYLYCHNKLFTCRYYNFEDVIEFVVAYIGSNDNAHCYRYEVVLLTASCEAINKKGTRCLGWNEIALARAVTFDLQNECRKKLKARLSILRL
ncbi:Sina domain containing protein [Asbolus verrucosus]|uniref:Sina domain containing protein n=1 Tax=Asbolus verrucosus TaxID=1661398 RepID=A0A482VXS5_ASBVE|nr:Sina domain containing protein [Asbolus verrucosus]